jgi:hypothetical protein
LQDPEIRPFLDWSQQRQVHAAVIAQGLAAEVPGLSLPRFLHHVLSHADDALRRRGKGEEEFLRPLHRRLREKRNPGQRAVDVFKQHGMKVRVSLADSNVNRVVLVTVFHAFSSVRL